jgi:hypothetical protein
VDKKTQLGTNGNGQDDYAVRKRFGSDRDLAVISGLSPRTLCKWRLLGKSPFPWVKISSAVRYDLQAAVEILEGKRKPEVPL